MVGYGLNRGAARIIGCFWLYAGILEYLQNFSPGRNPALVDFAASAFGALCGGVAVLLLCRYRSAPVGRRTLPSTLEGEQHRLGGVWSYQGWACPQGLGSTCFTGAIPL